MKKNKREKEKDTGYTIQLFRSDIQDCKHMVAALSLYTKSKNLNRGERTQVDSLFKIPGYTKDHKTTAFKLVDLPRNKTQKMDDLNSSSSSSDSFSIGMLN